MITKFYITSALILLLLAGCSQKDKPETKQDTYSKDEDEAIIEKRLDTNYRLNPNMAFFDNVPDVPTVKQELYRCENGNYTIKTLLLGKGYMNYYWNQINCVPFDSISIVRVREYNKAIDEHIKISRLK